jgi:hypothetical protein
MTAAFLRDAAAGMAQGARRGLDPVAADRGRRWRHDLAELVGPDGVRLARSRPVAVSAFTGLGAGTVLLAAALWSLASALLWP